MRNKNTTSVAMNTVLGKGDKSIVIRAAYNRLNHRLDYISLLLTYVSRALQSRSTSHTFQHICRIHHSLALPITHIPTHLLNSSLALPITHIPTHLSNSSLEPPYHRPDIQQPSLAPSLFITHHCENSNNDGHATSNSK
jgi:hypothetical protein